VGQYGDSSVLRPLVAVSNNQGASWSYPEAVNAVEFTPNNTYPFTTGNFNNVSWAGNTCVATGSYVDSNIIAHPLWAVSNDLGIVWSFPESTTSAVFSPNNTYPFVNPKHHAQAACKRVV